MDEILVTRDSDLAGCRVRQISGVEIRGPAANRVPIIDTLLRAGFTVELKHSDEERFGLIAYAAKD